MARHYNRRKTVEETSITNEMLDNGYSLEFKKQVISKIGRPSIFSGTADEVFVFELVDESGRVTNRFLIPPNFLAKCVDKMALETGGARGYI